MGGGVLVTYLSQKKTNEGATIPYQCILENPGRRLPKLSTAHTGPPHLNGGV